MRLNKGDQRLTGKQIQDFRQALRDAFSKNSLEELLLFQLDRRLEDFTSGRDFPTDIRYVIDRADEEGWTAQLLQAARMWRPQNLALLVFSQQFGLAPAFASSDVFESKIRPHLVDLDVVQWRTRLSELEAQICCIEIAGSRADDFGTGFLLGPDIVMTSFHVIEKVMSGQSAPERVTLRFDYKALADGRTVNEGTKYHLAQHGWRIDCSKYSPLDRLADTGGALPTLDELDYAILKVDGKPGEDPPFSGDNRDPQARQRGWIPIPSVPLEPVPSMELLILHHPEGDRLKFTLNTDSVLDMNANQTRIRYQTNTAHGTSGAPCFNLNWELVALHHTGDPDAGPGRQARFNQGIPFSTILSRLERRGIRKLLGNASPIKLEAQTHTSSATPQEPPASPDEAPPMNLEVQTHASSSSPQEPPAPPAKDHEHKEHPPLHTSTSSSHDDSVSLDREALFERLSTCPLPIFLTTIFFMGLSSSFLSENTSRHQKAIELIEWAMHDDGPGLETLRNSYLRATKKKHEEQLNPLVHQEPINLREYHNTYDTEKPPPKQARGYIESAQKCLGEAIAQFDDKKKTVIRKQFKKAINALTTTRQHIHDLCTLLDKLTTLSDTARVDIDFQATFIKEHIDKNLIPALSSNVQVNFSSLQKSLVKISQLIPKDEP